MSLGPEDVAHPSVGEDRPVGRLVVVERALGLARVLVIVPAVVLVLAAVGAFVYGTAVFVDSVRQIAEHPLPVGSNIGRFLLVIDLFLVGATLLIAAIGLYELFVGRLEGGGLSRLPAWLQMDDLNELKARVIAMVVLVVAVSFVETVVDVANARRVLETGVGIGAVIVALTAFLRFSGGGHGDV